MPRTSQPLLTALLLCLATVGAAAQDVPGEAQAPANLAYVEGSVDLLHDGITERADPPMLLLEGDVVRTRGGRAEIVFADGSILHLDVGTDIEILAPERLRLLHGRALLRLSAAADRPYTVDTPAATVRMDAVGEYGIVADQLRGDLEVSVARGVAEIDDGSQRATVRGGQLLALASAGARPLYQSFNTARFDAFAQWSNGRAYGVAASQSSAQLPYELRPYAPVLDQYGRWDYVAPHGYVWFPLVGVAWRPYYEGAWNHTRYGWTWHGRDRWAWPTHHYGRWGFNGSFWYWIPARVWGPAWVSWGFAPGYVSWSPLGWDGLPAIGFNAGYAYNPWRSWTVVPRDRFGFRRPVRVHAVDGGRLDDRVRSALILQSTPPAASNYAVSRDSISSPGARGSVRQANPEITRRGNVRMPSASRDAEPNAFAPPSVSSRRIESGTEAPAPGMADTAVTRDPRSRRITPAAPGGSDAADGPAYRVAPRAPVNRRAPATEGASGAPSAQEASDAPVYRAAPDTSDAPSVRGRARDGAAAPRADVDGESRGGGRADTPRSQPRAESPRSEGTRDSGGARQRGTAAGAPAQGAPAPAAPPPAGGAVRRRPGA